MFLFIGTDKSFGLLLVEFLRAYDTTVSTISIVLAIKTFVYSIAGRAFVHEFVNIVRFYNNLVRIHISQEQPGKLNSINHVKYKRCTAQLQGRVRFTLVSEY